MQEQANAGDQHRVKYIQVFPLEAINFKFLVLKCSGTL